MHAKALLSGARSVGAILLASCAICAVTVLAIKSTPFSGGITVIWPAEGIILALMLGRFKNQPFLLLMIAEAACALGDIALGSQYEVPLVMALVRGIGTWILYLLINKHFGEERITDSKGLISFLAVALLISLIDGAIFSFAIHLRSATPAFAYVYAGTAMQIEGYAVLTPLLVILFRPAPIEAVVDWRCPRIIGIMALFNLAVLGIFLQSRFPLLYFIPLGFTLLAYTLDLRAVACCILMTVLIGFCATLLGYGPVQLERGNIAEKVQVLQTFNAVVTAAALPMAALMAEHARLKQSLAALAVTDSLTGLANRRYLDEAFEREYRRAFRTHTPISLLMIDADNFKAFNDHYGHQAGDRCLVSLAEVLRSTTRRLGDVCARYGGEEFAVLLPETDGPGAIRVAEAIRRATEALAVPHPGNPAGIVTVSIGVATAQGRSPQSTPVSLISAADEALYMAKRKGRNRVVPAPAAPR